MALKPEQVAEINDAVDDALNDILPKFMGEDIMSRLMTAMEANIGHADLPDGRTVAITLVVEIESDGGD